MKLISFAIPSYNSEAYLHHAVETIITGGEEVEIIIVNDGSKDRTAEIANAYAKKYPSIIKAIHKENGGHGSGVNRGVQEATGLYFKVVDSDDWVDEKALKSLLATIRGHVAKNIQPDVYFTNFVYEHAEDQTTFTRHFRKQFPLGRVFSWDEVNRFYGSQLLLMHSVMFRTDVIRKSGTVLPEHTFYVDNLFAFRPLPYCKKLFYCDVDLYRYFIGRSDQSITIENLTKRYDQQIRVMKCMFDSYSYDELQSMEKGLKRYMFHCLGSIMMNTMMFCCSGGDDSERRKAYNEFWAYLEQNDYKLCNHLKHNGFPALAWWMPWKPRGAVLLLGYNILCKVNKLG